MLFLIFAKNHRSSSHRN